MSFSLTEKISNLRQDRLLRKVVQSSAHLFTNNTISHGLGVLFGPLAIRILGPADFGLILIIMSYASTINSILSFRMSELVVRYWGEYLEQGKIQKAAAIMKAASLGEGIVSLLAFACVLLSAGWASQSLAKSPGTAWLFGLFAIGLLANGNAETSIGILQASDRIKLQGTINLLQSLVTLVILVAALIWQGSLLTVLSAYLAGKVLLGAGLFVAAQRQLKLLLGQGWWKTSLSLLAPHKELFQFAISSNLSATIIKVFRESELLWIGLFLSTTAVSYYKIAYALVSLLSVPADPLIAATYPEINRLVVQKGWLRLKGFLQRISGLSLAINICIAFGFILIGRLALTLYGGDDQFASAYPTLIVLLTGLAFNYTLFWNRPLLLALGLPSFPVKITLLIGMIKVALAFYLVPRYGILAAGALLSFYYIATVGIMVWRGWREIRNQMNKPQTGLGSPV